MTTDRTTYQLLLRIRLSARYHQQRRRVYLRRGRIAAYLNVLASLAMVASVLQQAPLALQVAIPFSVMLFTLADTLFGFTALAYEHQLLYRRWIDVEAWMMSAGLPDDELTAAVMPRILAIEADEPPENRAAVNLCDNELLRAEGHDREPHPVGVVGKLFACV